MISWLRFEGFRRPLLLAALLPLAAGAAVDPVKFQVIAGTEPIAIGETVVHDFARIVNDRDTTITLSAFLSDCTCVSELESPVVVPPRSAKNVSLRVVPAWPVGLRTITLRPLFNDGVKGEALRLALHIIPAYVIEHESPVLLPDEKARRLTYRIKTRTHRPLGVVQVTCPPASAVKAEVITETDLKIEVTLAEKYFIESPGAFLPRTAIQVGVKTESENAALKDFAFPAIPRGTPGLGTK